jgi:hypothetical protein
LSCSSGCSCSGSRRLSLGTAALTYVLALSSLSYDQALQLLATRVFGVVSNDVLIGIALFVLYGRLCAFMSVRSRLASALTGLFGHRGVCPAGPWAEVSDRDRQGLEGLRPAAQSR